MRDRPHEVGQKVLEHVDVEGVHHDHDAGGSFLTQDEGAGLDHSCLGIAGAGEADRPPLRAPASQVMQQRVQAGLGDVGIVAEIPASIEQRAGIQPASCTFAKVVPRCLIRR